MNYAIKTEKFSGPLEVLLQMIEAKKLKITELNLARVTADFLVYLNTAHDIHPRLLADFIVVASRLLLIKSRALLPNIPLTAEDEEDIKNLETRLQFYQNFKPAINSVKKLYEQNQFSLARPFMASRPVIFYPSSNINFLNLKKGIAGIFEILNKLELETKIIRAPLVSLEEKIEEIINILKSDNHLNLQFHHLKKEQTRSEIIVMFLAVLHLIERQLVKVRQNEKFSDIIIEKA